MLRAIPVARRCLLFALDMILRKQDEERARATCAELSAELTRVPPEHADRLEALLRRCLLIPDNTHDGYTTFGKQSSIRRRWERAVHANELLDDVGEITRALLSLDWVPFPRLEIAFVCPAGEHDPRVLALLDGVCEQIYAVRALGTSTSLCDADLIVVDPIGPKLWPGLGAFFQRSEAFLAGTPPPRTPLILLIRSWLDIPIPLETPRAPSRITPILWPEQTTLLSAHCIQERVLTLPGNARTATTPPSLFPARSAPAA